MSEPDAISDSSPIVQHQRRPFDEFQTTQLAPEKRFPILREASPPAPPRHAGIRPQYYGEEPGMERAYARGTPGPIYVETPPYAPYGMERSGQGRRMPESALFDRAER